MCAKSRRTIKDQYTRKEVILTDKEVDMIEKMPKSVCVCVRV